MSAASVLAWRHVEAYSSWCYALGKAGEYKIYYENGDRALYLPGGARAAFNSVEEAKKAADEHEESFLASRAPSTSKFWMVLGIDQGVPRYRHFTMKSASEEANRLAGVHPGVMFVVLEVVDAYQAEQPKINKFDIAPPPSGRDCDDDIPF